MTVILALLAMQETVIEQEVAPDQVPKTGKLGTMGYKARENEKAWFAKLDEDARVTGSMFADYEIQGKKGKYVSWFGIVRESTATKEGASLLVDHKYFDGLTDTHILALSFLGSGDFQAQVKAKKVEIPALALVRMYGTVTEEQDRVPVVQVDYLRVFPWKTFTFLDCYGVDRRSEKWKKLCTVKDDDIYDPYPDDEYYIKRLGERAKM